MSATATIRAEVKRRDNVVRGGHPVASASKAARGAARADAILVRRARLVMARRG
jgi:hypothetical protein